MYIPETPTMLVYLGSVLRFFFIFVCVMKKLLFRFFCEYIYFNLMCQQYITQ